MQIQSNSLVELNEFKIKSKYYLLLTLLTMMSVSGLVGSDIYIPAIPIIQKYFQINVKSMQLALGIYLIGLSFSQLIYGFLSDKFGRKRPLVFGLIVFLVSSIICSVATNFTIFLIARLLQAVGAGAGLVIGRVIVGDLFTPKDAAKVFSTIFPFVGMSPAISPLIGGFLTGIFGWRSTFILITIFSLILCCSVFFLLQESYNKPDKSEKKNFNIIKNYSILCFSKRFWTYALIPCVAYIAYFSYISQSPFIFHNQGYSPQVIGTFYISLSISYVLGNLTGKRVLNLLELDSSLKIGYCFCIIGGALLSIIGLLAQFHPALMIGSISVLTFGNGFLIPQGTAGVVSGFQNNRGLASGLLGFFQLGLASISAMIIGTVSFNTLFGLGLYTFIVCFIGFLLFLFLIKGD